MHNSVLPHQDFFIYVPSQVDDRQHSPYSAHAEQFLTDQSRWIQIPLVGTLVVYARMLDAQEHTDVQPPDCLACTG